jgi:hypothetical protein
VLAPGVLYAPTGHRALSLLTLEEVLVAKDFGQNFTWFTLHWMAQELFSPTAPCAREESHGSHNSSLGV